MVDVYRWIDVCLLVCHFAQRRVQMVGFRGKSNDLVADQLGKRQPPALNRTVPLLFSLIMPGVVDINTVKCVVIGDGAVGKVRMIFNTLYSAL